MRYLLSFLVIYWDFVSPESEILLSSKPICGFNCFPHIICGSKDIWFLNSQSNKPIASLVKVSSTVVLASWLHGNISCYFSWGHNTAGCPRWYSTCTEPRSPAAGVFVMEPLAVFSALVWTIPWRVLLFSPLGWHLEVCSSRTPLH